MSNFPDYWPPSPCYIEIESLDEEEYPDPPSIPMSPMPPSKPAFVLPEPAPIPTDDLKKRYDEIVADRDEKTKIMSQMRDDFYMVKRELEVEKARNTRLKRLLNSSIHKKNLMEKNHESLKDKLAHLNDILTDVVTSLDSPQC